MVMWEIITGREPYEVDLWKIWVFDFNRQCGYLKLICQLQDTGQLSLACVEQDLRSQRRYVVILVDV